MFKIRPVFILTAFSFWVFPLLASAAANIKYVALGDSYTVGTGSGPQQAWPSLLVERAQKRGMSVELTANLAHNGWTTQNLIDYELPALEQVHPDIVTILIGANDWVKDVDKDTFKKHIHLILERLLTIIPARSILIVTIPDFSVTPFGAHYSIGKDISKGIAEFNQIITQEADSFGVKVVDLYPFSQGMGKDLTLVATDGLHPSAKEHSKWADFIEPEFLNLVLKARK